MIIVKIRKHEISKTIMMDLHDLEENEDREPVWVNHDQDITGKDRNNVPTYESALVGETDEVPGLQSSAA